ncbi:hypothetical protein Tco_0635086 [Tanacetum coccineum]
MAVLESCPKHNMVAYLEKTNGNAEFHEIIDFLTRSFIHYALTVSPIVSTTFVEQFWTSAKSKIINNVRHITAKVAGKPVSISEASIRSDLLFDDADGIDSLPNQAIFDVIQLMGYEGDLTGKHFSGKVTPLFASMLEQPTEDEGAPSERPSETQPTPSPPHPSKATVDPQSDPSPRPSPSTTIPDSIPESSGRNHGGFRSSQGNSTLEGIDQEAQEVSKTCYHTPQSMDEECFLKAKIGRKEILKEKLDAKGVCCAKSEDSIKEVVTETMMKLTLQEYIEEVQADYDSNTTTPRFDENAKFELRDEFLKILRDNAFNEINGDDVVDHTAKVLAILELIKIPNVDPNQACFPTLAYWRCTKVVDK